MSEGCRSLPGLSTCTTYIVNEILQFLSVVLGNLEVLSLKEALAMSLEGLNFGYMVSMVAGRHHRIPEAF